MFSPVNLKSKITSVRFSLWVKVENEGRRVPAEGILYERRWELQCKRHKGVTEHGRKQLPCSRRSLGSAFWLLPFTPCVNCVRCLPSENHFPCLQDGGDEVHLSPPLTQTYPLVEFSWVRSREGQEPAGLHCFWCRCLLAVWPWGSGLASLFFS